jgi:hypothetical protein
VTVQARSRLHPRLGQLRAHLRPLLAHLRNHHLTHCLFLTHHSPTNLGPLGRAWARSRFSNRVSNRELLLLRQSAVTNDPMNITC